MNPVMLKLLMGPVAFWLAVVVCTFLMKKPVRQYVCMVLVAAALVDAFVFARRESPEDSWGGILLPQMMTFAAVVGVLTLPGLVISLWKKHDRWIILVNATCAAALMIWLIHLSIGSRLNDRIALREMFPFESMASRLTWEDLPNVRNLQPPELSAAVDRELKFWDNSDGFQGFSRPYLLQNLHNLATDEFIAANGFGGTRMARPSVRNLQQMLFTLVPLPQDKMAIERARSKLDDRALANPFKDFNDSEAVVTQGKTRPSVPLNSFQKLHDHDLDVFLNPDRSGYIRDRDHVAGFQSHQFSQVPFTWSKYPTLELEKLELVSLLKHESAGVYQSNDLPNLELNPDATLRELDEFEQTALKELQTDKNLIIAESDNLIRMLGSLRAGESCMKCHSVPRGTLLGAFSYCIRVK